jgi:hypothetical protein
VPDNHVAELQEPVDGSQPPETEATQTASIPSAASFMPAVIDDMAAQVIMPRLGEEEVFPEMPGFLLWMLGDDSVSSVAQDMFGGDGLKLGSGAVGSVLAQRPGCMPAGLIRSGPEKNLLAPAPVHLEPASSPPRKIAEAISGGRLLASPSPDNISIDAPVLATLCTSPEPTATGPTSATAQGTSLETSVATPVLKDLLQASTTYC